jgi:hypothetical protein
MAVAAAIRSGEAEPLVSASAVSACGGIAADCGGAVTLPAGSPRPAGLANVIISGSGPSGSAAASAATSCAYAPGVRRTVCAALLIRMSSGPWALTESARAITWAGSRRSIPTIRRRCSQSPLSGIAANRRTASWGNRVVTVVCAPSRSSRTAMYMPIFARPPVSSARRPVRSVRAFRRSRLSAAQGGQS